MVNYSTHAPLNPESHHSLRAFLSASTSLSPHSSSYLISVVFSPLEVFQLQILPHCSIPHKRKLAVEDRKWVTGGDAQSGSLWSFKNPLLPAKSDPALLVYTGQMPDSVSKFTVDDWRKEAGPDLSCRNASVRAPTKVHILVLKCKWLQRLSFLWDHNQVQDLPD